MSKITIPTKSLSDGFELPVYGLGTWGMGGRYEADYSEDERYTNAIRSAIDHGVTHIDTAELYGAGHAEELIAQATQGVPRGNFIVTSKILPGLAGGYDGVLRACQASLERLQTDYIDLYLLHRCPASRLADIMRAMDRLVDEGMVRHIGVSNFTTRRFVATQELTTNKLTCNQLEYSLECREITDRGILQHAQTQGVIVTAWGPLSAGALEDTDILRQMAQKYDKTPYQIALNWLITQPNVITIPKTTTADHLRENLGALGWALEQTDWQALTDNFPNQQLRSTRVPLDYAAEIAV